MPRRAKSDPLYKEYAYNRHTPRKSEKRDFTFVAWDGEGSTLNPHYSEQVPFLLENKKINPAFDLAQNEHRYNLLVNSTATDAWIYAEEGLTTLRCFEFFIRTEKKLRAARQKSVHVIFAGGYDMNMIFRGLPRKQLENLQHHGMAFWHPYQGTTGYYKIEWFPRKMLILTWVPRKREVGEKNRSIPGTVQFILFDVWGFFQTSFLKTIEDFQKTIHFPEYDLIQQGKAARGSFLGTEEEMLGPTLTYCQAELSALVRIMDALNSALVDAEMEIKSWHGPGAIASAVLKKHHVTDYYAELPYSVQIAVETAFFGGRIEMLKIGHTNKPVFDYDVRSCYPSAMPKLVQLSGGDWFKIHHPDEAASALTLYHIEWSFPDWPFYPFPFRYPDQTIVYPCEGEGWYHSPEIEAVMRAIPDWPRYVKIIEGWTFRPAEDAIYPLAFVAEYYKIRAKLKKAGNKAQMAFKLALNSLYGKLAQKVGYSKEKGIEKSLPFLNLLYAGFITAHGRAMLFELAMQKPEAIIAFQTDGVFTLEKLDANLSDELGAWELSVVDKGYTCCQAGVYFMKKTNSKTGVVESISKYRGFSKDAFTMEKIHAAWNANLRSLPDERSQFKTLGGCLMGERLKYWTQWLPTRKDLDITGGNNKRRSYAPDKHYSVLTKKLMPLGVCSNKFYGLCSAKKLYPWDADYDEAMKLVNTSIEEQEEENETAMWEER